jgi:hypothetical protein
LSDGGDPVLQVVDVDDLAGIDGEDVDRHALEAAPRRRLDAWSRLPDSSGDATEETVRAQADCDAVKARTFSTVATAQNGANTIPTWRPCRDTRG